MNNYDEAFVTVRVVFPRGGLPYRDNARRLQDGIQAVEHAIQLHKEQQEKGAPVYVSDVVGVEMR